MTTIRSILNSIADSIDYGTWFTFKEREEIVARIKKVQDLVFASYDKMVESNEHMRGVGFWPYLERMIEAGRPKCSTRPAAGSSQVEVGMQRWAFLFQLSGGHRYFRDRVNGKVAVADNSGNFPDETENGVLYISQNSPVRIGREATITVTDTDGNVASVIECAENGIKLAALLDMRVNAHGVNYQLVQV